MLVFGCLKRCLVICQDPQNGVLFMIKIFTQSAASDTATSTIRSIRVQRTRPSWTRFINSCFVETTWKRGDSIQNYHFFSFRVWDPRGGWRDFEGMGEAGIISTGGRIDSPLDICPPSSLSFWSSPGGRHLCLDLILSHHLQFSVDDVSGMVLSSFILAYSRACRALCVKYSFISFCCVSAFVCLFVCLEEAINILVLSYTSITLVHIYGEFIYWYYPPIILTLDDHFRIELNISVLSYLQWGILKGLHLSLFRK